MLYGLFLSAQGAEVQSLRQDVVAHNLANASTAAYKRDVPVFRAFLPWDVAEGALDKIPDHLRDVAGGVSAFHVRTDYSPAGFEATGRALDVALAGPGFLRVSDGQEEFLTRDGRLDIEPDGRLVTRESRLNVLDANGQPLVAAPAGGPLAIAGDGLVTQGDGDAVLGRLGIVEPQDYLQLEKVGDNRFRNAGGVVPPARAVAVKSGHLENSGTQPVLELLDLIESTRALEANVNLIKFQDESLSHLLGTMARR